MSVDKLVDSTQLDADLTSVANAIRTKGGTSASLAFPADFVSAIAAIPSGGGVTAATGEFTLLSDTTEVSTSQRSITLPGFQLSFKPDFVWISMLKSSFEAEATVTSNIRCYIAIKNTYIPLVRFAADASTASLTNDYMFFTMFMVNTCSDSPSGSAIGSISSPGLQRINDAEWSVNSDGTVNYGYNYNNKTRFKAGTYRYFAVKV